MNRVVNLRKPEQNRPAPIARTAAVLRPAHVVRADAQRADTAHADAVSADGIAWRVRHEHDGSRRVTVFVGVLALLAAVVFVFQQNLLLAVLLVLGAAVFVITPRVRHEVRASLEPHGVVINGATYYYRDLESFWVEYVPGGIKELSLRVARWYLPYVKVPLGDKNPNHIRGFLVEFLPEEEHDTSFVDALMRFLRIY